MARKHTVWDSQSQTQIDIPFTDAEEIKRDAEEVQAAIDMAVRDERVERQGALAAKLADDSITFEEMKELMRLRG